MQVNYFGTVRCTKTALPYMREGAGAIAPLRPHLVNISSTAGLVGLPFAGAQLLCDERCSMRCAAGRTLGRLASSRT